MSERSEAAFFREVSKRNPEVARSLEILERRAADALSGAARIETRRSREEHTGATRYRIEDEPALSRRDVDLEPAEARPASFQPSRPGFLVYVLGLAFCALAVFLLYLFGHWAWRTMQATTLPWHTVALLIGTLVLVTVLVLGLAQVSIRFDAAPNAQTSEPVSELERFARGSAARLNRTYHWCLTLAISIHILGVGLITWGCWLVSSKREVLGSVFGGTGISGVVFAQKWHPFSKVQEARRLADDAHVLAMGLAITLQSINAIPDPGERAKAQWEATQRYLKESKAA